MCWGLFLQFIGIPFLVEGFSIHIAKKSAHTMESHFGAKALGSSHWHSSRTSQESRERESREREREREQREREREREREGEMERQRE